MSFEHVVLDRAARWCGILQQAPCIRSVSRQKRNQWDQIQEDEDDDDDGDGDEQQQLLLHWTEW